LRELEEVAGAGFAEGTPQLGMFEPPALPMLFLI